MSAVRTAGWAVAKQHSSHLTAHLAAQVRTTAMVMCTVQSWKLDDPLCGGRSPADGVYTLATQPPPQTACSLTGERRSRCWQAPSHHAYPSEHCSAANINFAAPPKDGSACLAGSCDGIGCTVAEMTPAETASLVQLHGRDPPTAASTVGPASFPPSSTLFWAAGEHEAIAAATNAAFGTPRGPGSLWQGAEAGALATSAPPCAQVTRGCIGKGEELQGAMLEGALDEMCASLKPFLGRYVLLGAGNRRQGGQGVVQFARDVSTGDDFAIKYAPSANLYAAATLHPTHPPACVCLTDSFQPIVDCDIISGGTLAKPEVSPSNLRLGPQA
jgi:hypothetical protein